MQREGKYIKKKEDYEPLGEIPMEEERGLLQTLMAFLLV